MPPELPQALREFQGNGKWMWLADAAKVSDQKTRNLRNRLRRLDRSVGGGILQRYGSGRYAHLRVNLEALEYAHKTASHLAIREIDELREQLIDTEGKLEAMRRAWLELRAKLASQ